MTDSLAADEIRYLTTPIEEPVRYKINFINTAVCELRFPVLLELEEQRPVNFQKALRKEYPNFSISKTISLSAEAVEKDKRFLFESKKKDWTVSLKPSTLSLETSKYTDFEEFLERLDGLLKSVGSFLDTDFFTRIGLRYINAVPIIDDEIDGWVNPALISSLNEGVFGTLAAFKHEVRGYIQDGEYNFRHGIDMTDETAIKYMLDYDYSSKNVEVDDTFKMLTQFNEINFSFFRWSLGQKAKDLLGDGTKKK